MAASELSTPTPSPDPWAGLRAFTAARIALGRSGVSVPLRAALDFRLAHAHARDAVYSTLNIEQLMAAVAALNHTTLQVHSRAQSREQYLQRPDYGRQLDEASAARLTEAAPPAGGLVIVLADGLSATAVNDHAGPLLALLLPRLRATGLHPGPVVLAEQARVALGDAVGHCLRARLVLVLIGERPGLSAPNSLGAYLTYAPRPGLTDEARNCVSNIRPEGLDYPAAANRLAYLLQAAWQRQLSGVVLKDDSTPLLS